MQNKHLVTVIALALISLGVMWAPFMIKAGNIWGIDFAHRNMQTIVSNFDGINFLIVAKTWYNPQQIVSDYSDILSGRNARYFSAHYPGFPFLIAIFDLFLTGPQALMAAIVLSNVLLAAFLWMFFSQVMKNEQKAALIALVALFFPARMLSMRSVGSNESLFICLVIASLLAAAKNKHWLAGIMGGLAVLTRSPGILLMGAYGWHALVQWRSAQSNSERVEVVKKFYPYLLIPSMLLMLWAGYGIVFGDFWAYFKVGGNINLYLPPFLVFGSHFDWISGMWLEDIVYTYLFYGVGIYLFGITYTKDSKAWKPTYYFGITYFLTILCIVHRDISRYALPIAPIALAGFAPYIKPKYAKYGLVLLIPIILYSWNFILNNFQPIMDWTKYL